MLCRILRPLLVHFQPPKWVELAYRVAVSNKCVTRAQSVFSGPPYLIHTVCVCVHGCLYSRIPLPSPEYLQVSCTDSVGITVKWSSGAPLCVAELPMRKMDGRQTPACSYIMISSIYLGTFCRWGIANIAVMQR